MTSLLAQAPHEELARPHAAMNLNNIKNKFSSDLRERFFSIQWDEKLLKQGDDYEPKEHIAILSSHGNDIKLLGTTRLDSGTGLNQDNAIKNMLDEWDIQELCLGMCFDTTASNTGKFSGACILLEAILGYPLLRIACRNHVLETILSNVAKLVFGPSDGPKIDCFNALSQKWPALDLQKETFHVNVGKNILEEHVKAARSCLINILSDKTSYCPRDDHKELPQLSLCYIDKTIFSKFTFRRPGSHHRARRMSSAICALKMLLLQNQLELDDELFQKLQVFGDFVACFYVPNWLRAPLDAEAAVQDLTLYQSMLYYNKNDELPPQEIAARVTNSMKRHCWYLTEELLPLCLCSKHVKPEEKERLALRLFQIYRRIMQVELMLQKPQFPVVFEETKLYDLLGERSTILFNRLQFTVEDIQFLRYFCTKWPQYESYLRLERTVSSLKVVNDAAERGIRLLEEYKDILTKDFGQRNLIMQCVEESRKNLPNFKKSTLSTSSAAGI